MDYKGIINEVFDELSEHLIKYKLNYSVKSNFFFGNIYCKESLDKISLRAADLDKADL
jgi:hypothetical protein